MKIKIYTWTTKKEAHDIWDTMNDGSHTHRSYPDNGLMLEPDGTIHALVDIDKFGMAEINFPRYQEELAELLRDIKTIERDYPDD